MPANSKLVQTVRLVAYGVASAFAAIVLGLSANLINITTTFLDGYFAFSALGLAVSIMTLGTLVPILVIDQMRQGAFTSMVSVNIGLAGFLSILWLSTGASAAGDVVASLVFSGTCSFRDATADSACGSYRASEAFAFLNWLILGGFAIALTVLAVMAQSRGNRGIWTASITDTDFFARQDVTTAPQMQAPAPQMAQPMPPQQGYSPGPQSYPGSPMMQTTPLQGVPQGGNPQFSHV